MSQNSKITIEVNDIVVNKENGRVCKVIDIGYRPNSKFEDSSESVGVVDIENGTYYEVHVSQLSRRMQ
jgi:hypothetical protein